MEPTRKIRRIIKAKPTLEGAGVRLRRAFGFDELPEFDPFLMLDEFRSSNPQEYLPGFPWHPHRGIETISYVLEGAVEHQDSMGNKGVIGPGEVQWMTAGSGIIHQEMPQGDARGHLWGLQLWSNLPAARKMMAPRYREVKAVDIPEVEAASGVKIKVICGQAAGVQGPVRDVVAHPSYLDVTIPAKTEYLHLTRPEDNIFAYMLEGEAQFCLKPEPIGAGHVVLFAAGERLEITSGEKPVRLLLVSGQPLNEPIAWGGPMVMNSDRELRLAFEEYELGTFLKHGSVNKFL